MTGVPEWLTKTFERPDEKPQEGTDSTTEAVGDQRLLDGEKNAGAPASATLTTQKTTDEKKPGKADIRIKGEFATPLPEDIQDERQLIRQKELNFAEAQSFTRMNAGRALAQTKAMAQEIFAEDANEMERLNREHYSRWERENEQLRADIDAARQLRVNPNNYMQRIGRSGRVSSVLSVAVSQLAAGAGNPNQVWNRIKATIDQDITAQKANIELEYAGIEAAQGQQTHEANMLEKYYGFEEKSRAVAMAALEAQVGVIMQRATNEGEYQAYQMIRDRARAEQIDAAAQALAKNATLFLDAPTHQAYMVLLKSRKWKEAQAMLQAANTGALGGAQDVDTSVQSYDQYGQPVTFGDPEPVPAEAPQSPVEAAPAPGGARVAKRRPSREAPSSPEQQVATEPTPTETPVAQEEAPLTPQEADMEQRLGAAVPAQDQVTLTPEEKAEQDRADKELRNRAAAAQVEQGIRQRMTDETINKGGYRFEELERLGMKPQGFNRFTEARDIILDPTNPEIAVFPSYEDAKEGLKYDTRTGDRANYDRKHPELYEQDTFLEHEGTKTKPRWIETNYVESAWGRIKLARSSTLRSNTEARDEFRNKVNKDFLRAQDIRRQSEAIRKYGTGQFLGLQIGKDGITWIGTDGGEEMNERLAGQIGLGIRAMKQLDPSGRLTDKDIEVGIQFMTAMLTKPTVKAWETLSSIYRSVTGQDPTKGAVRQSLRRVFAATATKLSDAIAIEHIGDIVMNYDQDQKFSKDRNEVDKWLRSEEAE
jgi:hypothetical protein